MNDPSVHIASEAASAHPYPDGRHAGAAPPNHHRSRTRKKLLIFICVFLLTALVGLTYTFTRPAIYQSDATLQLVPADTPRNTITVASSFAQEAALQLQALMSRELLTRLLDHLSQAGFSSRTAPHNLQTAQQMLHVIPVENSAIIKLRAEGPHPEILPEVVNLWLDLYLGKHATAQKTESSKTAMAIEHQLGELGPKITTKRAELAIFREKFDIVSMEREENQIVSKLNGLYSALNKAGESRVLAEANLAAIQDAIKQGKWAGKYKKQPELVTLEQQAELLKEKINDLENRYTSKFIQLDKDAKSLYGALAGVEEKIRLAYEENRKSAVEEAQQAIVSARLAENDLETQLAEYKKKASIFSSRFSEHATLQETIAQLEALQRTLQEQLVAMEIKSTPDTLQIKVLERAFTPEHPVRPDYPRDAGISIALSCLLGIVAVLCYELFTRSPPTPAGGNTHITYNQVFPNAYPVLPGPQHERATEKLLTDNMKG